MNNSLDMNYLSYIKCIRLTTTNKRFLCKYVNMNCNLPKPDNITTVMFAPLSGNQKYKNYYLLILVLQITTLKLG